MKAKILILIFSIIGNVLLAEVVPRLYQKEKDGSLTQLFFDESGFSIRRTPVDVFITYDSGVLKDVELDHMGVTLHYTPTDLRRHLTAALLVQRNREKYRVRFQVDDETLKNSKLFIALYPPKEQDSVEPFAPRRLAGYEIHFFDKSEIESGSE